MRIRSKISVYSNGTHDVILNSCLSYRMYFTATAASAFTGQVIISGDSIQPALTYFQVPFIEALPLEFPGDNVHYYNDQFTLTISGLGEDEKLVLHQTILYNE